MSLQDHGFIKLMKLEDALHIIKNSIPQKPLNPVKIDSVRSLGRVITEDVTSNTVLPDRNSSAMDGYAVNSKDVEDASVTNHAKLRIVGELYPADYPTNLSIKENETIYVACGAPIPLGADSVIRIERVRKTNGYIILNEPVRSNRNICTFGEDVKIEDTVIRKGSVIRPPDIGMLVALNRKSINVFRKPKVSIISVGDELVQPFNEKGLGIINNNAYIISSLLEYFGSDPIQINITKDNTEDISKSILNAINRSDLVLTIAGCSIGKKDYVPKALNNIGDSGLKFHGLAISSGKVSGFGIVEGKPVIMLPGFIGSTISAFYLIVLPLLNMWRGLGFSDRLPTVRCIIDETVEAKPGIEKILPVKIYWKAENEHAIPSLKPLSVLNSYIDSNGYTTIPPGEKFEKGETINVKIFGSLEFYNMAK